MPLLEAIEQRAEAQGVVIAVGLTAVPLVAAWIVGAALVGWIWSRARPVFRLALALVLVPACVLLAWEGGLLFLPAAFALIAISFSLGSARYRSWP